MRVAAYQAPFLPFGSRAAVELIARQLPACRAAGVDVLCCPEAIIGGLAHESSGQSPAEVALSVEELAVVAQPLYDDRVSVLVGFTELGAAGELFSSAAVLTGDGLAAVYRKVYPGYRTVIRAGRQLPLFHHGATPYGIVICNDLWYPEPARVLAAAGAAIIFVPTHSGHLREPSESFRARGENLPVARAVDTTCAVVVADVAGHQGERMSYGFSAILDPDGRVLARARPLREELLVADVPPQRRPSRDPRGWDGYTNAAVTERFLRLWTAPHSATARADAGPGERQ